MTALEAGHQYQIASRHQFASREEFREWLCENCQSAEGIWLVFGKKGGPKTLSTSEALEEALCFGWVDGLIKSIDAKTWMKYFAQRRKGSCWSPKNRGLVETLEKQGKMTDYGRAKVEEAKKTAKWDIPTRPVTDEDIAILSEALKSTEPAYSNFLAMPPSARRTYSGAYRANVADEAKAKCLVLLIDRLNKNLKPMERI